MSDAYRRPSAEQQAYLYDPFAPAPIESGRNRAYSPHFTDESPGPRSEIAAAFTARAPSTTKRRKPPTA